MQEERRSYPRINISQNARYVFEYKQSKNPFEKKSIALIENLSASGFLLRTEDSFPINKILSGKLEIPVPAKKFKVEVRVVRLEPNKSRKSTNNIGVVFTKIKKKDRQLLSIEE